MNIWSIIALLVLALAIPAISFGLGLATATTTNDDKEFPENEQEAWALGILATSLTLADIVWVLS